MNQKNEREPDGRPLIQGEAEGTGAGDLTDSLHLEISLKQRKKKILMGVGIGIVSIVVILIIVLSNKAANDPKTPFEFYNPYVIDP
jgi:hypothetical protein